MARWTAVFALAVAGLGLGLSNEADAGVRRFVHVGPYGGVTVGRVGPLGGRVVTTHVAPRAYYGPVIRQPVIGVVAPPVIINPVQYEVINTPYPTVYEGVYFP